MNKKLSFIAAKHKIFLSLSRMSKPHEVTDCLKRLGAHIEIARRRRRLTLKQMAGRLDVSIPTYMAIECGSPAVKLSNYLTALWVMGLLTQAMRVGHPDRDAHGKELEIRRLLKGRERSLKARPETTGAHDF